MPRTARHGTSLLFRTLLTAGLLSVLLCSHGQAAPAPFGLSGQYFPGSELGLSNGDFESAGRSKSSAADWQTWPAGSKQRYTRTSGAGLNGSAALLITSPGRASGVGAFQHVAVNQREPAPLFLSVQGRELKAGKSSSRQPLVFGLNAVVHYSDGSEAKGISAAFTNKRASGEGSEPGWQEAHCYIWPDYVKDHPGLARAIDSLDIYVLYGGLDGTAVFDDVRLLELSSDTSSLTKPGGVTRLLSYSTMNPLYAADHAEQWAKRGFSGFMFDHGQLIFGDAPKAAADPAVFKACISTLRSAGIGDNFLLVQNRRGDGPDFAQVFDNAAWKTLLGSFTLMADYAKDTGLKGIVLDMEPGIGPQQPQTFLGYYADNGHSETETAAQVYSRGQQVMQTLEQGYPGLTVILLPQLATSGEKNYRFYGDFFAGMASVASDGPAQIIIGEELSQTVWTAEDFGVPGILRGEQRAAAAALGSHPETAQLSWDAGSNLAFGPAPTAYWRPLRGGRGAGWAGNPAVFGERDLGTPYKDKSSKYRADYFYEQLAAIHSAQPRAQYAWIFDQGASMWQMSASELSGYGPDGDRPAPGIRWAYRRRIHYSQEAVDPFLDYFFSALAAFYGRS